MSIGDVYLEGKELMARGDKRKFVNSILHFFFTLMERRGKKVHDYLL